MTHELTCIVCPNGCALTVKEENGKVTVEGAGCKNGVAYGEQEIIAPKRTLTTTLRVKNGDFPLVSVRSEQPICKADLLVCMKKLEGKCVEAPVRIGELLFEDAETGLRLLASKNINRK